MWFLNSEVLAPFSSNFNEISAFLSFRIVIGHFPLSVI
jgi:hypothetical protein